MLLLLFCGVAQADHYHATSPAEIWAQSGFARCVRMRESTDGRGAQNLYQIQGPRAHGNFGDYGWLNGVPRKQQNQIAYQMFKARGDQPWRPYDHCYWGMSY